MTATVNIQPGKRVGVHTVCVFYDLIQWTRGRYCIHNKREALPQLYVKAVAYKAMEIRYMQKGRHWNNCFKNISQADSSLKI